MKSKKPTLNEILTHLERDPGAWVLSVFKKHDVKAPELRARTGLPGSTCRAFLNGSRPNPTLGQFRLFLTAALDVLGMSRR